MIVFLRASNEAYLFIFVSPEFSHKSESSTTVSFSDYGFKKYLNKIPQINPSGAILVVSLCIISKIMYYIHNFCDEKLAEEIKLLTFIRAEA